MSAILSTMVGNGGTSTLPPMTGAVTARRRRKQRLDLKTIRVAVGSYFVGEIHLDGNNRVRRHADTVPSDVVLKALVQHTRYGDLCGKLVGLKDGREFYWHVVGSGVSDELDEVADECPDRTGLCAEDDF